jgi:hypothetical protein
MAEHKGCTNPVNDSYNANRRKLLVETFDDVKVDLEIIFS